MDKRIVVWTETAIRQRREVLKYWTLRNKSDKFALKLIKVTKQKVKLLADFPNSGVETEFPEIRMSSLGHFSIFYKVEEKRIIIVAFWDNRQDPKSLFESLRNKNIV